MIIKNSTQVSKKLRQDIQQLIIWGGVDGSKVKGERRCKMTEYVQNLNVGVLTEYLEPILRNQLYHFCDLCLWEINLRT